MNRRQRLEYMSRIIVLILLVRSLFPSFFQPLKTQTKNHDEWNDGIVVVMKHEQPTTTTPEKSRDILVAQNESLLVKSQQQPHEQSLLDNEIHWCRFNHSTLADSMAHIHDIFMPCWSWLQSFPNPENCGFIFGKKNSFYFLRKHTPDEHWRLDLFQAMNCTVSEAKNANDFQPNIVKEPVLDTSSVTGLTRLRFHHPSHAWALRDAVLRRFHSSLVVDDQRPLNRLAPRIGFLQRGGGTRLIDNMIELISYIRERLPPEAEIIYDTWGYDQNRSLVSQAEWFATKDIIIAAHGQALSNSIFIRNSTIVIEIFPRYWGWLTFYGCTIVQAGGRYMYYYDGNGATIESDWIRYHKKHWWKSNNITVRPESLWKLVEAALQQDNTPIRDVIVFRGSTLYSN